jgi:hypothetical protein
VGDVLPPMYDDGAMSSAPQPDPPRSDEGMVDIVESGPKPSGVTVGMSTDGGVSLPVPRRAGRGTGRDLAISLSVLIIPLLVLVWFFQPRPSDTAEPVDAAGVYQTAKDQKAFHVREPHGLSGWKPTVAVYSPATAGRFTIRVSYSVSKTSDYLQLVESNAPADSLIASIIDHSEPLGTEQINGESWTHYTARAGAENAYILLASDVTVVVVGDAPIDTAKTMIRSLR